MFLKELDIYKLYSSEDSLSANVNERKCESMSSIRR